MPDDVDPRELDIEARKQLSSLAKDTADLVAKHLVMAGRLVDEDPEQALRHARAARALGGRVGVVREANGLVAYAAGEWAEALTELRTARRITGEPDHLPVMADCERALGRPDRALVIAEDPQVGQLSPAARVEMLIVVSGARRDMGQAAAAAASLDIAALEGPVRPWTARLRYAYADALLESGREDEARSWFARAAEVDEAGETDADERVLELDGVVFDDLEDEDRDPSDAVRLDDDREPRDAAGLDEDREPVDAPGLDDEAPGIVDNTSAIDRDASGIDDDAAERAASASERQADTTRAPEEAPQQPAEEPVKTTSTGVFSHQVDATDAPVEKSTSVANPQFSGGADGDEGDLTLFD